VTTFGHEPENQGVRRQRLLAALFFLLSALAIFLPAGAKQGASFLFRGSILRPFIATQQKINSARLRARETEALQAQLDSLAAILATRGSMVYENRALRALLGARDRLGPSFRASTVIRAGLGAESTFLLELGADDGVEVGAPVVDRHGLVGAILEVRSGESLGMDWTHPDFRASAMLADGTGFGIVETRRGVFREDDRLVLNGTAYHETVPEGTLVVTSGLGVYPRGIPIGVIDEVADEEGGWRKSYWLRPMVHPAGVDHVLVQVAGDSGDLSAAWPADSALTNADAALRLRAQADSLALLRRILGARGDTVGSTRP
jgi:rod shape-determining protein MreC